MMIQTARDGAPRFVMRMDEHTALAGQFARAFGNERFEPVSPRELMLYLVDNHDKGWFAFDSAPSTDRKTGLPYDLIDTPAEIIAATSAASPDFNTRRHWYCGLLSSMHTWGLYNGRYGTSDKLSINDIPERDRPLIDRMLDAELERQALLKEQLAQDPETVPWVTQAQISQNYRQLQFFDTLALYFNRVHQEARRVEIFPNVPMNSEDHARITVTPVDSCVYALRPFPFASSPARFAFSGRYVHSSREVIETNWASVLDELPQAWQEIVLIA